jgi:hypothetical protein
MVFKYRIANTSRGADDNVAVAKQPGWNDLKRGDLVAADSGWSGHAETELLDMVKAKGSIPRK